jgi:hypothetical protein
MTVSPLIISDCDDVLMHFAAPFAAYLDAEHAMDLKFQSFSLAGSITKRATGASLEQHEVEPLIDGFFATHIHTQLPVDGAAAALARLAEVADIVVLTNVRDVVRLARSQELLRHGMPYRVIPNQGPKGRPVAELAAGRGSAPVVFIDDLPPHHTSVAKRAPAVHRLHMVADPDLRELLPPAPDAHARIDHWAAAELWILDRLGQAGA